MSTLGAVEIRTLRDQAERHVQLLIEQRAASRLFTGDATLWGPEAEAEASIRLGWVRSPLHAPALVREILEVREALSAAGISRIVLCGMGGSSLAPEVIAARDAVPLTVLDSTHPATVSRVIGADPSRTAVVVSSKSGSTIETRSHLAAFEARFAAAGIDAADRIILVTDPGSELQRLGIERGYRVFLADPDVGGRYSALTAFGLVPAGLAGANIAGLVAEAAAALPGLAADDAENGAVVLASAIAAGVPDAYACALVETGERLGLTDWIEQLVAESTGKHGTGILPISVCPADPEANGALPRSGRLFALSYGISAESMEADVLVTAPLGAQLLIWEAATALLCSLLRVNPFDQPDVESAKLAAQAVLTDTRITPADAASVADAAHPVYRILHSAAGSSARTLGEELDAVRRGADPKGYVAIQIFADRGDEVSAWEALRAACVAVWQVPVSLGWGPRFLHSTGQLHKGGPAVGSYLQIVAESPQQDADAAFIPGQQIGFAELIAAQAQGDRSVLLERGRPVLSVSTSDLGQLRLEIESALRSE